MKWARTIEGASWFLGLATTAAIWAYLGNRPSKEQRKWIVGGIVGLGVLAIAGAAVPDPEEEGLSGYLVHGGGIRGYLVNQAGGPR